MATTRNGWAAAPAVRVPISAPGCADTGEVRAGDVATIMQALASAFDAEVEPLTTINGYRTSAYNAAVDGDPASNHISATALDFNGSRHPYERNLPASQRGANYKHGFTAAQVATVRKILARFGGVIGWGLDFNKGYRDAMHFEIRGSAADVARVAAALTATPAASAQEDDMFNDTDRYALNLILAAMGRVEQRSAALVTGQQTAQADLDKIEWGVLDDKAGARAMIGQAQAAIALLGASATDPDSPTTADGAAAAILDAIKALPDAVVEQLRARLA